MHFYVTCDRNRKQNSTLESVTNKFHIMSGQGKSGVGIGKGKSGVGKGKKGKGGHASRARVYRDNIFGAASKPALRRLARRGGVKRMNGIIYEDARKALKTFMEDVVRDSVTFCDHAKRRTVTALDVVHALKRRGKTLYGFGA